MRVTVDCFLMILMVMQIQVRNLIDHQILETWIFVHLSGLLLGWLRWAWFHCMFVLATQVFELLDSFVLDSQIFRIYCLLRCWGRPLQRWSWRSLVLLQPRIEQFRPSDRCLGLQSSQALSAFGSHQSLPFLALAGFHRSLSWILVIIRFCENLFAVHLDLLSMQHLLMHLYLLCCIFIIHFHFRHLSLMKTLLGCRTGPDVSFDSILGLLLRYHFEHIIVGWCWGSLPSLLKYFVGKLACIILLFFWSVFGFTNCFLLLLTLHIRWNQCALWPSVLLVVVLYELPVRFVDFRCVSISVVDTGVLHQLRIHNCWQAVLKRNNWFALC